jgi:hypothetical protein
VNGKFINKTTSKAIPSMCGLIVINHSELSHKNIEAMLQRALLAD